jgi:hypothetical protein
MTSKNEQSGPVAQSVEPSAGLNEERREALRRIGKFGAYTAPALLVMLASEQAPAVTDTSF